MQPAPPHSRGLHGDLQWRNFPGGEKLPHWSIKRSQNNPHHPPWSGSWPTRPHHTDVCAYIQLCTKHMVYVQIQVQGARMGEGKEPNAPSPQSLSHFRPWLAQTCFSVVDAVFQMLKRSHPSFDWSTSSIEMVDLELIIQHYQEIILITIFFLHGNSIENVIFRSVVRKHLGRSLATLSMEVNKKDLIH